MNQFKSQSGVLASIKHEWGGLCQGMDPVVVGKLSDRDPFVPVILSLINKELKELFNFLVDVFGLPVCLWVVGH